MSRLWLFPKNNMTKTRKNDKPDNFHDTSIRREECTFSCSLVFYVVSWSHSMDNISTHQTRTIIIIIQFKLPQRKCFTKNLKIIIIIIHRKIATLLSYRSKILLAYLKATSQSNAKSKTIKNSIY